MRIKLLCLKMPIRCLHVYQVNKIPLWEKSKKRRNSLKKDKQNLKRR